MSPLFGRRAPSGRPDLGSWDLRAPFIVVDGSGPGLAPVTDQFPELPPLRHVTSGGPGLPFFDGDLRRLPAGDESLELVVLWDVLDKVLDVGAAIAEAKRVLVDFDAPRVLVVQSVAPEDFDDRAAWNAVSRLRDPRHTWALSARQFAVLVGSFGLVVDREADWEETADPSATLRPELAQHLALLLDGVAERGGAGFLRDDGSLVVNRRAVLLRRGG
jgi:hypothetical protein